MDAAQRARDYSRLKDWLALIGVAANLLLSFVVLLSGLARRFNRAALPTREPSIGRRLRYDAAISLLSWLAGLPLSFYSGFIVERRFGLSTQTPAAWARDALKGKALSIGFELAAIEGVYSTLRRWPRRWWLVCAGAVIPVTAAFAQLFPVLILPRFNRYEPLRDEQLADHLRAMTDRAGVHVAEVQQMDMSRRTSKANAFFAGIGPTKRIVLADTLLERFTSDEVEGVVAHETAHQAHGDIWRSVALSGLFTLVSAKLVDIIARRALRAAPRLTGATELADHRSLPLLGVAFTLVGLLLTPLQLAYSRHIERNADRYAIALTGNPRAYAGAMRKLAEANLADPEPPRLTALLLHSHPPIAERVSAAERAAGD